MFVVNSATETNRTNVKFKKVHDQNDKYIIPINAQWKNDL